MTDNQVEMLATAIMRVAQGGPSCRPGGLEAMTMALASESDSVASGLHDVAAAIHEHTMAIDDSLADMTRAFSEIASAIRLQA